MHNNGDSFANRLWNVRILQHISNLWACIATGVGLDVCVAAVEV